ncbi:MAG: hypothetical protein KC635_00740, partial [Myxococcales bacterium]|nr:hypothetical protein [Myxococcales bacterium]
TGMPVLTPEYASPEQTRAEPVSTSTDVYSLGAVLYELLADAPAFESAADPAETLRRIREVEPPRPSVVAPPERRRALAGDLDNIVLKALRKDPDERYASVEQLAADIERHLAGLPVQARPQTFRYRAGKLLRRHRGKIAVATAFVASLTAATVFSSFQARRADAEARAAERRFTEVRKLANTLLFDLDGQVRNLHGAMKARELIVSMALEYLDRLDDETLRDPTLARERAYAYMRIGDILGSQYEPNLGRTSEGLASYDKARAILDGELAEAPADPANEDARVAWLFGVSFLEESGGRRAQAREHVSAALEAAARDPGRVDPTQLMRGYLNAASIEVMEGAVEAAKEKTARFIAAAAAWRDASDSPEADYWYGIAVATRGRIAGHSGDADAAAADERVARDAYARLALEHPDDARFTREEAFQRWILAGYLGGVGDSWAWTASTDDLDEAERELERAIARFDWMLQRDATDVRGRQEHAALISVLGAVVGRRDRARARVLLERSRAAWAEIRRTAPGEAYDSGLEWFAHCALAEQLALAGERDGALAAARDGLAIFGGDAGAALVDESLQCHWLVGRARLALGDADGAAAEAERVIVALEPRVASGSLEVSNAIGLGEALELLARARPRDACAARERAAQTWQAWSGPSTRFVTRRREAAEQAAVCAPVEAATD